MASARADTLSTLKSHAVAVVGYALMLVYSGLFVGWVNPEFFGVNDQATYSLYAQSMEIGQVVSLFVWAAVAMARPREADRAIIPLSVVFLSLGYALALNQAAGGVAPTWYTVLSGVVFGIGWACGFLGWFVVFSRMGFARASSTMVASTVLSAVLLLVIARMPNTFALFSTFSLVIAAGCTTLYWCLRRGGSAGGVAHETPASEKDACGWLESWVFVERRSLLCLVALSFVCGVQRVMSQGGFLSQDALPVVFALGYALGALVYVLVARYTATDGTYLKAYSILLAIMATCGVLSSIPDATLQTALYAVDNVAFTVVSICTVMTAVSASEKAPYHPLVLGGVVCGVLYLSIMLGRIAGGALDVILGSNVQRGMAISVVIVYAIALAAISSGAFFRQVMRGPRQVEVASADVAAQEGDDAEAPKDAERKSVISIASVTEGQIRSNPVYKQQYGLTDRELDTLMVLLAGYNAADIGEMLGISRNTVKTHLKNIYAKMGVHNRRELVELMNQIESVG